MKNGGDWYEVIKHTDISGFVVIVIEYWWEIFIKCMLCETSCVINRFEDLDPNGCRHDFIHFLPAINLD